jgi:hypothetical protein
LAVTDSTTRTHRDAEDRKYHFLARSKSQATLQGKIMAFLHHPMLALPFHLPKLAPGAGKPVARGRGRSARIADGLAIPLAITGTGEKAAADKDDF